MSSITLGANPSIRFDHINTGGGSVLSILNDRTGFLWFGTFLGLVRYDGYDFKVFNHTSNNPTSLSDNSVKVMIEDSQGNIWIGTEGGLNFFNTKTEKFTVYRHQANNPKSLSHDSVTSIVEDKQGHFWVSTNGGGLNYLNLKTQEFTHYRHQNNDSNTLSHDAVWSMTEDYRGHLWLGTWGGGLNHFNPKTETFVHYRHRTNDPNSLSDDIVRNIFVDSQNNLWVGSGGGGGLSFFDRKTEEFTTYRHQANNPNSLSDNFITNIFEDSHNKLWVGTWDGGLNLFDPETEKFSHYRHQDNDPSSLSHNTVRSISEDNQGNLLVGTDDGKINYFNPKTTQFTYYKIPNDSKTFYGNSIAEDKYGNLWLGTSGNGINLFNSQTQQSTNYSHNANDPFSLSGNYILSIYEDKQGRIWVGTWGGGLNLFDQKTKNFINYRHQGNVPIRSVFEDSQSNLWVGTDSGLDLFNPKSGKFTHYHQENSDSNMANNLNSDTVISITEDREGNIWFGKWGGGLNKYSPQTKQFTSYRHQLDNPNSLSGDFIWNVFEDSQENIWVGTYGGGLNLFDKKTKKFKRFDEKHGLPFDRITSIEEDDVGHIWVNGGGALSRFDATMDSFKNYYLSYIGTSLKSETGEFIVGSRNGFYRFYPENIIDEVTTPPKVVITDMLLLNKSVPIVPIDNLEFLETPLINTSIFDKIDFHLNQVIHETKTITLTHLDNIIAFEFSTLHFANPKGNQFAYQLVGWDKNWVSTDYKNRRATYTNLPYGDYIFRVKASDNVGYWNEAGTSLKIIVLPPPWKTWWAYTLYGMFLLSLVLAFIHSQRKKVIFERNVNAQLENKVVERTLQLQSKTEELQKSNTMLEKVSLTDQLTGLKNRRFLLNNIENDIALVLRKYKSSHESKSKDKPESSDLIFFLIDLDHFKMVNDIHGHTAGDAVLIQIKVILEQVFRETDYLVRWGGEEFLVIARFTERSNAPELAERLRETVENYEFSIGKDGAGEDNILKKTCSIGFACYPFSTQDTEALTWNQVIDVADHCMYAAKKSSRNAWVGLYAKTNEHDEGLFTEVIEKTQSLIQSDELKVLSSIAEIDQVIWMVGE